MTQRKTGLEELQVPTHRIPVEVYTDRGEVFAGGLFVAESPYHSSHVEHLVQALNDERSFLPFDAADADTDCAILNKDHMVRVKMKTAPVMLLEGLGGSLCDSKPCRVLMSDGARLEGHLTVDTPWSLSRLLDKLNRAERFVRLVDDEHIEFLQTSHIVRVD